MKGDNPLVENYSMLRPEVTEGANGLPIAAANAALLTHHYDQAIAYARKAHSIPHPGSAGVHIVAALALEATQQPFEAITEYQLYLHEDPKGRDALRAQQAIQRLNSPAPK